MKKRTWPLLLAAALVSGLFSSAPARAQTTEVPAVVQIDDPKGDANFLNDQDNAPAPLAGQGDHVTPQDASSATDLMKAWFSNTADSISLHFQTEAAPQGVAADFYFRFASNPGEGPVGSNTARGCIYWTFIVNGTAGGYTGPDQAQVNDQCNVGTPGDATLAVAQLGDGTGVTTITIPRTYSPLFADGGKITQPYGLARYVVVGPLPLPPPASPLATAATSDTTKRGTDYMIASAGTTKPKKQPPGKSDPPGKKKGCKKGKGQKKGCKPKKSPPLGAACPTYTPYDAAKEAPITTVTDADTAEKPVEVPVATEAGLGAGRNPGSLGRAVSHAYLNVVVDSAAPETGLWASVEFTETWDYDLYIDLSDGTEVAHSGGVGPVDDDAPAEDTDSDSQPGSETVTGLTTPDCQGYTLDIVGATTPGEEVTVKLWLGEAKFAPSE